MIRETIKNYLLSNKKDLITLVRQFNSYNGSFDYADTWDLEELCNCCGDTFELARAIIYGNVTNINDDVRYNAYGNLESISQFELEEECESDIEEVLNTLEEFIENGAINSIYLPEALKKII